MKNHIKMGVFLIGCAVLSMSVAADQGTDTAKTKIIKPAYTAVPPKLDGVLDDEAWKSGPIIDEDLYTYQPAWGEVLPQKTKIYAAYDKHNLYFAFYCMDNEPDKIKATMAKRDSAYADDWVGVVF
jgi:hypothetical protein